MKYLISDEVQKGQCPVEFLKSELRLTDLRLSSCIIAETLKTKVAMFELARIFRENGVQSVTVGDSDITLNHTGNSISFSDIEVECRFESVFFDLTEQISQERDAPSDGRMICSNKMG